MEGRGVGSVLICGYNLTFFLAYLWVSGRGATAQESELDLIV